MILIYFLILSVLSILTAAYYRYAIKTNILDTPSARSSHSIPTVRGGGIVFFMAVLLYFIWQFKIEFPFFLSGFLILSTIGFIDDKKDLSPKTRFPFQLLAIGLILYDAGLFSQNIPIIFQITAFIIAVGFINAFNFMDGINGITGFYTLAIVLPLLFLNYEHPVFNNDFYYFVIIAIIVFGYFNFRKQALMFAGDIGSMSLAAVILFWIAKTIIVLNSPIVLSFVVIYGVDSALTIMLRIKKKEKVFEAHRHHLYQKFVDVWKWSHLKFSFMYALSQILISFFVLNLIQVKYIYQIIILAGTYILFSVLYLIFQNYFKKITKN
jgi:UDP-N-acetylmuramyl pentapeptide phosphotransferase/UDP-N-acetylglucosamine-1-phosphate transferase